MMDEGDEATAPGWSRTVSADGGVVREREKLGVGVEFCFLEAGYEDGSILEEGGEFTMGIKDAVAIELEDTAGVGDGKWAGSGGRWAGSCLVSGGRRNK